MDSWFEAPDICWEIILVWSRVKRYKNKFHKRKFLTGIEIRALFSGAA